MDVFGREEGHSGRVPRSTCSGCHLDLVSRDGCRVMTKIIIRLLLGIQGAQPLRVEAGQGISGYMEILYASIHWSVSIAS